MNVKYESALLFKDKASIIIANISSEMFPGWKFINIEEKIIENNPTKTFRWELVKGVKKMVFGWKGSKNDFDFSEGNQPCILDKVISNSEWFMNADKLPLKLKEYREELKKRMK